MAAPTAAPACCCTQEMQLALLRIAVASAAHWQEMSWRLSPLWAGLCLAELPSLVELLRVTLCGTAASQSSPRSPPSAGGTCCPQ